MVTVALFEGGRQEMTMQGISPLEIDQRNEAAIQTFIDGWDEERRAVGQSLQDEYVDAGPTIDSLVVIPVDSEQETPKTLEHTLVQYTEQTLDRSRWELLLLFNRLYGTKGLRERQLLEVAQSFIGALTLHTPCLQYDKPVTMGRIRSDLMDQAILHKGRPFIALSHDADLEYMSDTYLEEMTDAALRNPQHMFFSCELKWGEVDPASLPDRVMAYWYELIDLAHSERDRVPTSDSNTAIRLDQYCAVAQFDYNVDVTVRSEMADLRLRATKRLGRDAVGYVPGIERRDNGRRAHAAIAAGRPPAEMTIAGRFSTFDDEVRANGLDVRQVTLTPSELRILLQDMEATYIPRLQKNGVTASMLAKVKARLGLLI